MLPLCCGHRLPVLAQDTSWLLWDFKAVPQANDEVLLHLTATLAPGWHIYSQHLGNGGPQPTRITYVESTAYVLSGEATESGNQSRFYSPIFEMDIVWFSSSATFSQKIKLREPVTTIHGKIDYMTCNDTICVPGRREFRVDVAARKPRH